VHPGQKREGTGVGGRLPRQLRFDQALHLDMGGALHLQRALGRITRVVLGQGSLDVDRVGVMPFDQIGIVAVHDPRHLGDAAMRQRVQAAAQGHRSGGLHS